MPKVSSKPEHFEAIELDILGMDCVNCANSIVTYISKLNGIFSIDINFTTEVANVEYNPNIISKNAIINDIRKMGYDVLETEDDEASETKKHDVLISARNNIILSSVLTIIIIAVSMSGHHGFYNLKIPYKISLIILFSLTTIVIFRTGSKFLKGAWNAIKNRTSDMNSLITLGVMSSYIYSIVISANYLFNLKINALRNSNEVYYETAAMIITLILTGNFLETILKSKSQTSINKLKELQAKFVNVIRNGDEIIIPYKKVRKDDLVLIKSGDKIPVDGTIEEGYCVIDESAMTGESIPIEKKKGDRLISGTLMKNGFVKLRAEKVGKDTMLSQIIDLVKDASNSKPKIQRLADKISSIFVPVVVAISLLTLVIWHYIIGLSFEESLLYAVSVLIIACPCALGLASPMAVVIGIGRAAENGILFNNVEAIEKINKINTICFDKTGTITTGEINVSGIRTFNGFTETEMLKYAFSIEKYSNHPIAKSIYNYCVDNNIGISDNVNNVNLEEGLGISGTVDSKMILIGNINLMEKHNIEIPEEEKNNGSKKFMVGIDGKIAGAITFKDNIKEDAKETIYSLKRQGINSFMISGDNEETTQEVSESVGIENYSSGTLPQDKEKIIASLQEEGKNVAMVGDGINDAPSLARSNVGIAIGTGQDIAIDSADVILVKGKLKNLLRSINISSKTVSIIKQNIFWAFFYNIIAIPLAAGILSPYGIIVSPVLAAMLMAFSDIITVMINSLRLKYVNINY